MIKLSKDQNSECLENFFHARKFKALMLYISSLFSKNSKSGSKKNIEEHYDLGNEFYELWLDSSMTYSSGFFNNKPLDLHRSQEAKYQNILNKLVGKNILEMNKNFFLRL